MLDAKKMIAFLESHQNDETWKHFSFLTLVVEVDNGEFNIGTFLHGKGNEGGIP